MLAKLVVLTPSPVTPPSKGVGLGPSVNRLFETRADWVERMVAASEPAASHARDRSTTAD